MRSKRLYAPWACCVAANHGLFVADSSGVPGEWPKLLLTRADDGLLYLDHSQPDERAAQHDIVTGMPGFEVVPSHDQGCEALIRHSSDPQADVLEYIKRESANLALLNKDNHARNTAVQRSVYGRTSWPGPTNWRPCADDHGQALPHTLGSGTAAASPAGG